MTAIDEYRRLLEHLVGVYEVESVLEIGVQKGISTEVFCEMGCSVRGIDTKDKGYRHENLVFIKGDASEYLSKLARTPTFDIAYLDAHYTYKRLKQDVPRIWDMVDKAIIFNEYIDFADHRKGEVRKFVNEWTHKMNITPFTVYPLRNGLAVVAK